ncbi:hypothetical protein SAMN05920897_1101, partial [Alkalispirochaeta americana]
MGNREAIQHMKTIREQVRLGGGEARIEQQHQKGKHTAR